ncbi:hypothetical protein M2271_006930 [Streptomyces sp. LBL]|nr:hypothetical protein [Streptomyces sp. LBL]
MVLRPLRRASRSVLVDQRSQVPVEGRLVCRACPSLTVTPIVFVPVKGSGPLV